MAPDIKPVSSFTTNLISYNRSVLTCSGRRKLSESFNQRRSLTAVSTALVVSPVVVSTSMVLAVVLWSRSPAVPTGEPTEGAQAWGRAGDSSDRKDKTQHDSEPLCSCEVFPV